MFLQHLKIRYGFFVLQIVPKQMNALVTDEFDP